MKKSKCSWILRGRGRSSTGLPIPAVTGPLLGLAYIIVMPFIGVFLSVVLCGYRVSRATAVLLR